SPPSHGPLVRREPTHRLARLGGCYVCLEQASGRRTVGSVSHPARGFFPSRNARRRERAQNPHDALDHDELRRARDLGFRLDDRPGPSEREKCLAVGRSVPVRATSGSHALRALPSAPLEDVTFIRLRERSERAPRFAGTLATGDCPAPRAISRATGGPAKRPET